MFDSHNVFFWLDCGTLLGAVRDKKMIEWDDDMDFGLTKENFEKIPQFLQEFKKEFTAIYNPIKGGFSVESKFMYPLNFDVIKFTGSYAWKLWFSERRYKLKSFWLSLIERLANAANLRSCNSFFDVFPLKLRKFVAVLAWKLLLKMGCLVPRVVPRCHCDNFDVLEFYGEQFFVPSNVEDYLTCCYGNWRTPKSNWDFFVDAKENRPDLFDSLKCIN